MQAGTMQRDHREQLQQSWQANDDAWAAAVREQRIESRRLVTDAAIIQAGLAVHARWVIDIGAGAGWCSGGLSEQDTNAVGVDAAATVLVTARGACDGRSHVVGCGYTDIEKHAKQLVRFKVLVCKYALLEVP